MKKTKTQKGITLIALIITIVVLLILAVVAIGAVRDSNIIAYAQNAGTGYEQAKSDEESLLEQYESKIDQYLSKNKKYATVIDDTFLYLTLTPDNKLLYEVGSYSMNLDYSEVTLTEEILANAVGDSGSTNLADYSKALRVIAPDGSDAFVVISKDEKILYLDETPCFLTIPTDSYDRVYSQDGGTITLAANNTVTLAVEGETPESGVFEYIDVSDEMIASLIEQINYSGMSTNPQDYSKPVIILLDGDTIPGLLSKDEKTLYVGETKLTLTGKEVAKEIEPLDSYLYFVDDSNENIYGIFIDTDYTVEMWLMGNTYLGDVPWSVGNGKVASYYATNEGGIKGRPIIVTLGAWMGDSSGETLTIGYLADDNNIYSADNSIILINRSLLSESINFTYIYDTEETNELNMKNSYGLIQDADSATTGIYYSIIRYKDKYDCTTSITAKYKIEDGVIYLETLNDSNEGTGNYVAMSSTAKLRE